MRRRAWWRHAVLCVTMGWMAGAVSGGLLPGWCTAVVIVLAVALCASLAEDLRA